MTSINDELETLPIEFGYADDPKGQVLRSPRTGLLFVPYREYDSGWDCVIVKGNDVYPVGGHDIYVSRKEIARCRALRFILAE